MGKAKDLIGQKFGRLTVIEKTDERSTSGCIIWRCICDCGHTTKVSTSNLTSGHTQSCGCYNIDSSKARGPKLIKNLLGQRFGKLLVIERAEDYIRSNGTKKCQWKCLCDCGNTTIVAVDGLTSGKTKSCGCMRYKSYGEDKIKNILQTNNIEFQYEYTFDDCLFPETNKLARFDFYVNNQYLIEYDGKQHFTMENVGWGESIENIQKRDKYKNQYCLEHNLLLYRIPYYDYKKINTYEDLTQEKYLVKEIDHYHLDEPTV